MEQLPKTAKARLAALRPGPHPDAEQLNAFSENALSGAEREIVLAHLSTCVDCRDMVALSAAVRPADVPVAKPARGGFRWATFQWAAVAASLAIVTVAVLVVGPHQAKREQQVIESAQLKQEPASPAPVAVPSEANGTGTRVARSVPSPSSKDQAAPRREADAKLDQESNPKAKAEGGYIADGVSITDGGFGGIGGSKSTGRIVSVPNDEKKQPESAADEMAKSAPAANVSSGVNQPAAPSQKPMAQAAAPAPVAGEAARVQEQGKRQDELKDLSASTAVASTDSVELSSKAGPKPKYAERAAKPSAAGAASGGMVATRFVSSLPIWRVSNGKVQSSEDAGKTWHEHSPDLAVSWTSVAVSGQVVCAGGKAGVVYASRDNGQTWKKTVLTGVPPGDVLRIEMNSQTVHVLLSNGDNWYSADGGQSFSSLPSH
jgi:hypothetical protein